MDDRAWGCDSLLRSASAASGVTALALVVWLLVVAVGVGVEGVNVSVNACVQACNTNSIHPTHSAATIHRITSDGPIGALISDT
jgi:membrane protein required for beta-lactamase induction